ncbi:copper resistance CopC family protein [Corynebacterium sp. HS2168-gen11]|uniref:copper resistance CopC family protein n=1 Tax=Corynebacterium sp. HS2168-gen11 TaxID=2974027 RepID=UPI00216AD3C9|nr:copper resistance CopC family protein [Corynebacterium sp. HS2168-gen11]MCS4535211.1 copper resistance protein CopC [Corynebacterium sp. HS2168-gen11]
MTQQSGSIFKRSVRAWIVAGSLVATSTFGFAPIVGLQPIVARAHDVVVGGNPADGAVIDKLPETLVLEFSAQPKDGFNTIAVTDADKAVIFSGEPRVEGRNLLFDVPQDVTLKSGEYTIGFQITSSDGHATRGKTTFTISDAAASATMETHSEAEEGAMETQAPTTALEQGLEAAGFSRYWAYLAGIIGIFAVAGVVILRLTKKNK